MFQVVLVLLIVIIIMANMPPPIWHSTLIVKDCSVLIQLRTSILDDHVCPYLFIGHLLSRLSVVRCLVEAPVCA